MLVIRLTRKGRKNQPFFRIVVVDKRRSAKGGRAVEILGYLDPLTKKKSLKKERILYWLKNGAQPSATLHNMLVSEKIIKGKKINVSKKSKKKKEDKVTQPLVAPTPAPAEQSATEPVKQTPIPIEKPVEVPKEEPKPSVSIEVSAEAKNLVDKPAEKEIDKPAETPK